MEEMKKWRPWPSLISKKFQVKIILGRLEGFDFVSGGDLISKFRVRVKWKGPKFGLSSLRRSGKISISKEEEVRSDGVVEWNEEFQSISVLSAYKENLFLPWEITFTVFNVMNQGPKVKESVLGTALLNLAKYACVGEGREHEINVPLSLPSGDSESHSLLRLSLNLSELRTSQELSRTAQKPIFCVPLSPRSGEAASIEKDEQSPPQTGLKVKIFKYISNRKATKACRDEEYSSDSRYSARTNDGEYIYPFDSESPEDLEEEDLEDNKDDSIVQKSFNYGTLANANCTGVRNYAEMRKNGEYENWVYYSNRKSEFKPEQTFVDTTPSDKSFLQSSKRSILSWRKRKLSVGSSPKAKGEPLLKKAYGEDGGDDIDFDRRQLTSSDEFSSHWWYMGGEHSTTNRSEFGDDNFAIGRWEHKEVVSREGRMKLLTPVFFASIDQRNERAAGESACTALVAVIADWFQTNQDTMPIKSQFDSLIRDGSLEWRNLCENETYMERFPDKHFDLETVLEAKIRPLTVIQQKSFIGFFHPDGMDENSGFDFLHGAMSFDNIWDEINRANTDCLGNSGPHIYIISWNDHFFVLKVEREAYYIIDTLGERLYEGCNQAYILKFDRDTVIQRLPNEPKTSEDKPIPAKGSVFKPNKESQTAEAKDEDEVCRGKESCKEYIKNFLAAIPIRELQLDIKRGLKDSSHCHRRLQIELHYTEFRQPEPLPSEPTTEATTTEVTVVEEVGLPENCE